MINYDDVQNHRREGENCKMYTVSYSLLVRAKADTFKLKCILVCL